MRRIQLWTVASIIAGLFATQADAQIGPNFDPAGWEYGPFARIDGEVPIWNPVMQKIMNGEPVVGGTIFSADARTYCAMAAAGYDFSWTEMQHNATTMENAARMWRTCPGPMVPGVRVAQESEQNIQLPADMGAMVIFVPTVDTVEEAQRAVDWTYFPPFGRRSSGGGQGPAEIWNSVPGGYRATYNANVVLILMIETLEGVKNAREIAKIPGVTGLFPASGDLGNFSGFSQGDPEYEMLITEVVQAAQAAGKIACGPLRWMGVRPEYSCFQGSQDLANIRRGGQAELAEAQARWDAR